MMFQTDIFVTTAQYNIHNLIYNLTHLVNANKNYIQVWNYMEPHFLVRTKCSFICGKLLLNLNECSNLAKFLL